MTNSKVGFSLASIYTLALLTTLPKTYISFASNARDVKESKASHNSNTIANIYTHSYTLP